MIYNKIEQLIKVAEVMVEGPVNDFPKNLTNFKLILEGVKIALETDKKHTMEQSITARPDVVEGGPVTTGAIGVIKTEPIVKDEVPVVVKRKRRTKAEMLAAAAAAAETLETKVDDAIERVEKAGEALNVPAETIETVKNTVAESIKAQPVNSEEKTEDWEKVEADVEPTNILPWKMDIEDETPELDEGLEEIAEVEGPESAITALITKYPNPLNLALLESRDEKVKLVADMNEIKRLVGNNNTADIKDCLSKLNLEDAIVVRAYKFLMVLPHLETELK